MAFKAYEEEIYSRFGLGRFDDDSCKNKVEIETALYKRAKEYGVGRSALVISGPAVDRHLNNAYSLVNHVTLVEFSPAEYFQIIKVIAKSKEYSKLVATGKLSTVMTDVMYVSRSFDFEDLDLTQHLKTTQGIYIKRLANQAVMHSDPKGMIFTFSLRSGRTGEKQENLINRLNYIINILDAELIGFNGVTGGFPECKYLENIAICKDNKGYIYSLDPMFSRKGRIDHMIFLKYKDEGHMITGLILYR